MFQEVDTALLKLYAEINAPELEAFIAAGEITCDVKDCCDWLEKNKCYHALALLHRHAHDHDRALKVWAKIITGEYKDDSFHGLEFFIECLAKYVSHHKRIYIYYEGKRCTNICHFVNFISCNNIIVFPY
jgi:hypothetical protein